MPEDAPVRLEKEGRVARIILNRPERRNALSLQALKCLRATVAEVAVEDSVWVVVLTGAEVGRGGSPGSTTMVV